MCVNIIESNEATYFSICEYTHILAVQCHILLSFYCRADENVVLFQGNNKNIAMSQPAKTSSVLKNLLVVAKPPSPKQMRNKTILCKPIMHTKAVFCMPQLCTKKTQTGDKFSSLYILQISMHGLSRDDFLNIQSLT